MQKKTVPDIVEKSIKNDWLNVFLVASPILGIMSRMIIDFYGLKQDNILIISKRDTSLEIFNYDFIKVIPKKFDRYKEKLFFDSPSGRQILSKIKKAKKKFIIYSGGAWREVNWLLKNSECEGHLYIEEGQGSYMNYKPLSIKKISFFNKLKYNFRNRRNPEDGVGFYFRDDVKACIGLSKKSFPQIIDEKKFILKNFAEIMKYYKPKIIGIKNLGLTCSASRVSKKIDWEIMLRTLIDNLPDGSMIKPHPSFTTNEYVLKEFKSIFNKINNKNIKLCHSSVIIELEMLHEKKYLVGPQSSLSIYSKKLGSNYKFIKLF